MAEIHVQTKKRAGLTWVWVLIAVLLLAAIAWFLYRQGGGRMTDPDSGSPSVSGRDGKALPAQTTYWL